jgi:CRISPR/Cas system-associated exonuclease Cas4 (RecB family)
MDDRNISASQVKKAAQCMLEYRFAYIDDKEATKSESVYLDLGLRVHESIEDALTAESPPPLGHEQAVKAAIQNIYREKDEYPLPDDHYEDGMKYCAKAAEYIAKREPDIDAVEKRVEYRIERDDISTGVTAIMDVIAEGEIWDWKTGKVRDDTPHEEKIQGSIYMAAYLDEYGEEPDIIRFIYLKEGKVRSIEPEDDIWEYMIERAKRLVRAKKSGEFPANPGEHCYWCDYEYWCPASPVGMGNVPVEEY